VDNAVTTTSYKRVSLILENWLANTFNFFSVKYIDAYSLKARIVESQRPAIARQPLVNNNRGVFSALSLPMVAHATMEYSMPLLSNICTTTGERYFLFGPCQDYIRVEFSDI
jgi:hypothetical protein